CVEHHIVLVLGGYKTVNLASVLFKSLLFHHRGPLVFHFITDKQARQVLPTLFDTWSLPSVRYRIYDMEEYKKEVDWVPNKHYSSWYGLMRLAIPDILPEDVKEVLFLDTDLVVLDDITPLFDSFKGTNDSVLYAMGENLSPWYTQKKHWPARGHGFNAGVLLLHTERMRKANWSDMWKREARMRLEHFRGGNDQDILNALSVTYPAIMVAFPCIYNFQMGGQGQPERCQKTDQLVKIAHFNSPQKLQTRTKYVAHFAQYHATYQSMDGNVLRLRHRCESYNSTATVLADLKETKSECSALLTAIETVYRTHLYFNGFSPSNSSGDVTLITHLSVDRFDMLDELLDSWKGPVSAAIYGTDAEISQIEKYMTATRFARGRKNFSLHAVFKIGKYYPINYLRNVALNASNSEFVFVTDVGFIPSTGLYKTLRNVVKKKQTNRVLVIPAFENSSSEEKFQIPRSKDDLLKEWDAGKIHPFGKNSWREDHNDSAYEQWKESENPYDVEFNTGYELAVVMPRDVVPLFDERLIGYGWHNVTLLTTLRANGFHFMMIPSAFILHHPHASSFDISRHSASSLYKKCMNALRRRFSHDDNFLTLA
ncbi:hypothetical protein PENTCL1PPCAC_15055, partial [Pristionchus entomophagus]